MTLHLIHEISPKLLSGFLNLSITSPTRVHSIKTHRHFYAGETVLHTSVLRNIKILNIEMRTQL